MQTHRISVPRTYDAYDVGGDCLNGTLYLYPFLARLRCDESLKVACISMKDMTVRYTTGRDFELMWRRLPQSDGAWVGMKVPEQENFRVVVMRHDKVWKALPNKTRMIHTANPPWSPQEPSLLLVMHNDSAAMIFDLKAMKPVQRTPVTFGDVEHARWLPGNRVLVVSEDCRVGVLTPASFHETGELPRYYACAGIHPLSGELIITNVRTAETRIWRPGGRSLFVCNTIVTHTYTHGGAYTIMGEDWFAGLKPMMLYRYHPRHGIQRWRPPQTPSHRTVLASDPRTTIRDDSVFLLDLTDSRIQVTRYRGIPWR